MKLERHQRDYIKMLAKAGIGGTTEREVLWWLIQYAMNKIVTDEYVQKHIEQRNLLRRPADTTTNTPEDPKRE